MNATTINSRVNSPSCNFCQQASQYVLTALILIGRRPEGETISATELAAMLNSPTAYLSQMLAKLQEPGIIGSAPGGQRRGLHRQTAQKYPPH